MSDTTTLSSRRRGLLARAAAMVRQPLLANAGYLWGVTLVNSLAGFLFWGLGARLYRPEAVGIASATLSAVTLLSGLSSLGMSSGLVRYLPEARVPKRLLNTVFMFNALTAFLIGAAYLAGLEFWSPSLIALRQNALWAVGFLAYIIVTALSTAVQSSFVALRRAFYALIHTCVVSGGRLLLVAILANRGAAGLVGSVAVAVGFANILSLVLFLPKVEPGYCLRPDLLWSDLVTIVPYSAGNYLTGLLAQTPQMIMPLIALEVLGPESSGYVYIAWMLGGLLASPGVALASSAFAEGSNAPDKLSSILARTVVLGLALTVPSAMAVGIIAPWILELFGSSYSQAASGLLRWLAASTPLAVLVGLYFTHLRVQKRVDQLLLLGSIVAVVTLGIAILGMPHYGIAAAGIGWLLGNGLVATVALIVVWKGVARQRKEVERVAITAVTREWRSRQQVPTVVAGIPCYNEEKFIRDVVNRTSQHVDEVVVVDDGSSDRTVAVAREAGAQVVEHTVNQGYGGAIRSCLEWVKGNGADVLVTIDGDGQHNPDELPEVLEPLLNGEADLVIGSRFMGKETNVPRYRKFGIDVITFLYNFGSSTKVSDAQSGFRAYRREVVDAMKLTETGMGVSVETLIQARRKGCRIKEVPISCKYHSAGSTLNPVRHGVGVALTVIKLRLRTAFIGG